MTTFGKLPTPETWKKPLETLVSSKGIICLLDKQVGQTSVQDISGALNEYKRLYKAGIASSAEILTLSRAYPDSEKFMQAAARIENEPVVVGGPASVEMIDREGHLITTNALTKAFDKYMSNFRTRNAMVLHSDVQVGWALPAYISKGGQIFKSGVSDQGLFFITEVRDDTRIAKRVIEQINEGKLKSYSIAGSATKVQNMQKGLQPYMQVDEMELAEVTVCEKGVNQNAGFDVLKGMYLPKPGTCIDGSCLISKDHDHLDEIGTQTGKLGKDQVQYRDASEVEKNAGIMCGSCKYFNAGMSTCDLVNGYIAPGDWCSVFHPIDDSPVLENENNVREIMVLSNDGSVDLAKSFKNWMEKLSYTVDLGDTNMNGPSGLDLKFPGWRRNPEEYTDEIKREEANMNATNLDKMIQLLKANGNGEGGSEPASTEQEPFHTRADKTKTPRQFTPPKEDPDDTAREETERLNRDGDEPEATPTTPKFNPAKVPKAPGYRPDPNPTRTNIPTPGTPEWDRQKKDPVTKPESKALELFLKSEAMHTIENLGGRESEHHQLLREYGFPSEIPPEAGRYVPVVETETDD